MIIQRRIRDARTGYGWQAWLAAVVLALGMIGGASGARAETRTLTMYHLHTGERVTVAFKKDGRYLPDGLTKLNVFLRDWRHNEPTKMDPRLFDVIWQVYQASGSRQPINVVCGYRSPATNSMLRHRSRGVAEKSQHMLGRAMDFYIPDVRLAKVRELGLKLGAGGVGYYPTSGSPFVHLDVGSVRHWPRMSRRELVAIFPHGGTLHVPSDGRPLPGYDQALAAYQSRKQSGSIMMASIGGPKKKGGFFSSLFGGGGADQAEDDSGEQTVASIAPQPRATLAPQPGASGHRKLLALPGVEDASDEVGAAAPAALAAVAPAKQMRETIIAELPERAVPLPIRAPRPELDVGGIIASEQPAVETAAVPAPLAATEQAAVNVPLPTRRPDYGAAQTLVADASSSRAMGASRETSLSGENEDAAALSFAERLLGGSSAKAPVPSLRPAVAAPRNAAAGKEERVASLVPQPRPDIADDLPSAAAPSDVASNDPDNNTDEDAADAAVEGAQGVIPDDAPLGADSLMAPPKAAAASPRQARPKTTAASPRLAILESGNARAALTGARTTAKSDRPRPAGSRAQPRPVVVSVDAEEAARWALAKPDGAPTSKTTQRRSPAYDVIRHSPNEVLTQGFQQPTYVAEANRFTGQAVTFLPVAKFATN